jgi:hypothetical protein
MKYVPHPDVYKVKLGTKPEYVLTGKNAMAHIHADGLTPRRGRIWRPNTTLCGKPHTGHILHYIFTRLCKSCENIARSMGYDIDS